MMGLIRDRKSHYNSEISESNNYNYALPQYENSIQWQKRRPPLVSNKLKEDSSTLFPSHFIAVAMGIRFIVMATIWSIIYINSLFNQDSSISLNESFCGPCPKNWMCYRNNCYQFFNETKSWYQSQASCEAQNSSLLKIYNREDQDFLKLVKSFHWIGLVRNPSNGSWLWEDGSLLAPNQLTIIDMPNGTCAIYGSPFKVYTENCSAPNTYICMRRILKGARNKEFASSKGC